MFVLQGASWLLSVPGASSTVLEVAVPYSRISLVELLGQVRAHTPADTGAGTAAAAAAATSVALDICCIVTNLLLLAWTSTYCHATRSIGAVLQLNL
jgi:hypothetical protein